MKNRALIVRLAWLIPKCMWAIEHSDDVDYIKGRFRQFVSLVEEINKSDLTSVRESLNRGGLK